MLKTLINKEIRELLTKSSLIFFAGMALVFIFMGDMLSTSFEGTAQKPVVALVDQDDSSLSSLLRSVIDENANLVYNGVSLEEGLTSIKEADGVAVILIGLGFEQKLNSGTAADIKVTWLMKGTGLADSLPVSSVEVLLAACNHFLSSHFISNNAGYDAEFILSPLKRSYSTVYNDRVIEGVSPDAVSGMLTSKTMFIPIVIMMLIIMGSSSVISSMGLEKENRTLETLLTLPVRRSHIIISKIAGSALVGIVMGAIYMVGFVSYFNSITGQSGSLPDLGFSLGIIDYILIALSLFTTLLAGLCGSIILGTFASNYRSAQALTYPMTGLAMLPMLVTMMLDFHTLPLIVQIVLFIIPFTHPMIAMKELLIDNYTLVIAGIVYCSLLTSILVAISTRIFSTDRVVLGMSLKKKRSPVASA